MTHRQQFFQFMGCLLVSLAIFTGLQLTSGHAATRPNGIYQVPMKIIKADSSATSTANQFFGKTAVVRVQDDQVTVLMTSNGEQFIKSMKVAGQTVPLVKTVGQQALYQFNLTKETSPLATSFSLTTPLGAMKQQARLAMDWAQAKQVSSSLTTADLIAQAEKVAQANASSSSSVKIPQTTTQTPGTTATSGTKQTKTNSDYWRYQVLQGNQMVKSEADQYYTDVATVTPVQQGYSVTLKVKYAKSLKLGARAVVPETINGQQPQNVSYGHQGNDYTMTYSFAVASKSALKNQLIPGKIHVTVPTLSINETFPVRFRFASSGAADQASAASVAQLPKKAVSTGTAATANAKGRVHHQAKLPPTGETTDDGLVLLGLAGLLGSLVIWQRGLRHA